MTKTIAIAATLLLGSASFALAQGGTSSTGASKYSPGHEMQNSKTKTGPGASEYSPGDRMRDTGTVGRSKSKGASESSPGDRMNDQRKRY